MSGLIFVSVSKNTFLQAQSSSALSTCVVSPEIKRIRLVSPTPSVDLSNEAAEKLAKENRVRSSLRSLKVIFQPSKIEEVEENCTALASARNHEWSFPELIGSLTEKDILPTVALAAARERSAMKIALSQCASEVTEMVDWKAMKALVEALKFDKNGGT